jgi:cytochrome P450
MGTIAVDLGRFDPFDPAVLANPHPYFAWMRRAEPVFKVPGKEIYLITRHEDVQVALGDPLTFSNQFVSPALALGGGSPAIQDELATIRARGYPLTPTLLTNDPPSHTRFRKLVSRAFTPKRVASWQPAIERLAGELIDEFAPAGRVELVNQFAIPLPVRVIADALGVPRERQADFRRWTDDATSSIGADASDERRLQAARGLLEFQEYFASELDDRRRAPRDDLLTDLLQARIDDETDLDDRRPLDASEMLGIIQQLLVAGNETTTSLIAGAMLLLIDRPEDRQRVIESQEYAAAVVEEALRLTAPVQGMFRVARRDAVVGGVVIPAGATVILVYASANRDESQYADAEEFRPLRANVRHHLAFGGGIHYCIGAALSRAETQTAVRQLCQRLENPALDEKHPLDYTPSFILRRPTAVHLRFDPR